MKHGLPLSKFCNAIAFSLILYHFHQAKDSCPKKPLPTLNVNQILDLFVCTVKDIYTFSFFILLFYKPHSKATLWNVKNVKDKERRLGKTPMGVYSF